MNLFNKTDLNMFNKQTLLDFWKKYFFRKCLQHRSSQITSSPKTICQTCTQQCQSMTVSSMRCSEPAELKQNSLLDSESKIW